MKDTPGKPAPVTGSTLDERIKNARAQLDAQVREIVRWHFSPDTGTPFWLEKAYLLGKSEFDAAIRSTPVVVNGVMFVMTEKTLYAVDAKK